MTTELEVELTENFGFRLSRIIQATSPFEDAELPQTSLELIAWDNINNRFALADKEKLILNSTTELNKLLLDFSKEGLNELDSNLIVEQTGITHITFNSDYTKLIVATGTNLYQIDSFDKNSFELNPVIELTETVKALKKCPTHSNVVAMLFQSGELNLVNIGSRSSTKIKSDVTSFDWINGKDEIIVSSASNKISIINFKGDLVQDINASSSFEEGLTIKDVTSISELQFLIICTNEDNQPAYYLINIKTNEILKTENILSPVTDIARDSFFYKAVLTNWSSSFSKLTVLASSLSSDIEVLTPSKLIEELNDTDRAQLPMDEDTFIDAIPTGIVIDLTNTQKIETEISPRIEEESIDPLPRLVVLTHDGKLCVWNLFDVEKILSNSLTPLNDLKDSQLVSTAKENPDLSMSPPATSASTTTTEAIQPIAKDTTSTKPNPFASNKPFPTLETANNVFGNSGFGASTGGNTTASPFGTFGSNTGSEKPNPFAIGSGSTEKSSPFGTFGSNTSSEKPNPFAIGGGSTDKSSPFASFGNAKDKTNPVFGSGSTFGSSTRSSFPSLSGFGNTLQEQGSASTVSPFASLDSKKPITSDDDNDSDIGQSESGSDSDMDESTTGLRKPVKANAATNAGPTSFGSGPTSFGSGPTSFGSGPTSFGSGPTSFGSGPTSFGSGPTSFGSGPTNFGSTAFGSTGFGSTGFGTFGSKTEKAQDQKFDTTKSTFGSFGSSSATKDSPFGAFKKEGESSFGAIKKESESPFGALKSDSASPFGAIKKEGESPFGTLKSDSASPFGAIKKEGQSPFAAFKSDKPLFQTPTDDGNNADDNKAETIEQAGEKKPAEQVKDDEEESDKNITESKADDEVDSSESFTIVDTPQIPEDKSEILEPTSDENPLSSNDDEEGDHEIVKEEQAQSSNTEETDEAANTPEEAVEADTKAENHIVEESTEDSNDEEEDVEDEEEAEGEKEKAIEEEIEREEDEEEEEEREKEEEKKDEEIIERSESKNSVAFDEDGESEIYEEKTGHSLNNEDSKDASNFVEKDEDDVESSQDNISPTEKLTQLKSLLDSIKKLDAKDISKISEDEKNATLAALVKAINLNDDILSSRLSENPANIQSQASVSTDTKMVSHEIETEPEKYVSVQTEEKTIDSGIQAFEDDELYISKVNEPKPIRQYLTLGNVIQPDHPDAGIVEKKMQELVYFVEANFEILQKNLDTINDFVFDHTIQEDEEELFHTKVSLPYPSYWRLSESFTIYEFFDEKIGEFRRILNELNDLKQDMVARFDILDESNEKLLKISELINGFENFQKNVKLLKFRQLSFPHRSVKANILSKISKYEGFLKTFETKILVFKLILKITSGNDEKNEMIWDLLVSKLNALIKTHYSVLKELNVEIEQLSKQESRKNSEIFSTSTSSQGKELIPLKINELQNSRNSRLQIGEALRSRKLNAAAPVFH